MAINRVDVTATFIRTDVSQIKGEEDNRAYSDMTRLSAQFEQQAEENHIAVTQTEAYDANEEKFDAREEGKNKYIAIKKRKDEKKKEELRPDPEGVIIGPGGKPLYGAKRSSFDLKI